MITRLVDPAVYISSGWADPKYDIWLATSFVIFSHQFILIFLSISQYLFILPILHYLFILLSSVWADKDFWGCGVTPSYDDCCIESLVFPQERWCNGDNDDWCSGLGNCTRLIQLHKMPLLSITREDHLCSNDDHLCFNVVIRKHLRLWWIWFNKRWKTTKLDSWHSIGVASWLVGASF